MTKRADEAEAELAAVDAELEAAEPAEQQGEAEAEEAEQTLTANSAALLAEYAASHAQMTTQEEGLATTRASIEEKCAANLRRSRESLDLDREDKACVEEIKEADALLEKCARSDGEIDAEIASRRKACEDVREVYRREAGRLEADLAHFAECKARLLEFHDPAAPPGEAAGLLEEANASIASFRGTWAECQRVVRDGVVPRAEGAAPGAEAAQAAVVQAVRPRRWRTQPTVGATETQVEPGADGASNPAQASAPCVALPEPADVADRLDA